MKSFRKQSVTKTLYRYAYAEYLMHLAVPASQVTSALGVDSVTLAEINQNIQFIDIMKKTFIKKPYETMAMSELAFETDSGLLAASIVTEESLIESVGQELGPTYDLSQEIDPNTGKTFSHEWETGISE